MFFSGNPAQRLFRNRGAGPASVAGDASLEIKAHVRHQQGYPIGYRLPAQLQPTDPPDVSHPKPPGTDSEWQGCGCCTRRRFLSASSGYCCEGGCERGNPAGSGRCGPRTHPTGKGCVQRDPASIWNTALSCRNGQTGTLRISTSGFTHPIRPLRPNGSTGLRLQSSPSPTCLVDAPSHPRGGNTVGSSGHCLIESRMKCRFPVSPTRFSR